MNVETGDRPTGTLRTMETGFSARLRRDTRDLWCQYHETADQTKSTCPTGSGCKAPINPDFSPKNSVESDYLLQTNSYRNFREATKIQGVCPFRAVFRPAVGGFARFRRAIAV